jgi:RimJ/RimL family protein N-acetyltransferase
LAEQVKIRYEIDLAQRERSTTSSFRTRNLTPDDSDELAHLILDAYLGTIDYEGESIVEAREAIDEWLEDSPLLTSSFASLDGDAIVSATLVMMLDDEPFIGIVMTKPSHKAMGHGTAVVEATLDSLLDGEHRKIALYITEGNTASETLFNSLGAVQAP